MSTAESNVTELPTREPQALQVLLAEVLGRLPSIPKNGKAPDNMGAYQFRKHEDVIDALKPLCAEFGITYTPTTLERIDTTRTVGKYDSTMYVVDVHVLYVFRGPAGDQIEADTWGQGTDMGDKATQKAYTSSLKSMLTIVFQISEGEGADAEAHDVPESRPRRPWADKEVLDALYERATALPDSGKKLLRKRWTDHEDLSAFRVGAGIPADLVTVLEGFMAEAEAEGAANPDAQAAAEGQQSPPGATEPAAQAPDASTAPEPEVAPENPPEKKSAADVGVDPAVVTRVTAEVEKMTDGEVSAFINEHKLGKSGTKDQRRQRVLKAKVADAVHNKGQ